MSHTSNPCRGRRYPPTRAVSDTALGPLDTNDAVVGLASAEPAPKPRPATTTPDSSAPAMIRIKVQSVFIL